MADVTTLNVQLQDFTYIDETGSEFILPEMPEFLLSATSLAGSHKHSIKLPNGRT